MRFAVLGLLSLLVACGGGDAKKKKDAPSKETAQAGGESGSANETEQGESFKGDKPVEVAGSWLIDCKLGKQIDAQHAEVGCDAAPSATLALTAASPAWSVVDAQERKLDVETLDAKTAAGGKHDVVFKMPVKYVSTASVTAESAGGKPSRRPVRTLLGLAASTLECLTRESLIACLFYDPLPAGTAQASLTFDGYVQGVGELAAIACDAGGIKTGLIGAIGTLAGVGPKREKRKVDLDGSVCFQPFDLVRTMAADNLLVDGYLYDVRLTAAPKAPEGARPAYCLFALVTRGAETTLHIMHNPEAVASAKGGTSASDVLATVRKHPCK